MVFFNFWLSKTLIQFSFSNKMRRDEQKRFKSEQSELLLAKLSQKFRIIVANFSEKQFTSEKGRQQNPDVI